jgi:iron complex outermembrane receptor protein
MHRIQSLLGSAAAAAIVTSAFAAPPAEAQTNSDTPEPTAVDQVIVTATRRVEKLQDVPLSVTAISGDQVQQVGAVRLNDLAYQMPNVTILENSGAPTFTNVSIRGIEGRAGIYVDDVPISDSSGFNTYLIDIDRVEVLRGPQGTLFGTNTIAGTINTITKTPKNNYDVEGMLAYGDYNQFQAAGLVSGPIVPDKLYASIAASYRSRDGFETNLYNGKNVNNDNGFGLRAKLRFTPTEHLDATLSFDTDYTDVAPYYYKLTHVLLPGPAPVALDPNIYDRTVDEGPQQNSSTRRIYGGSLNIKYDVNGYTLTSITGTRWTTYSLDRDINYTPPNTLYGTYNGHFEQTSQEFRITSPDSGQFNWLAGFFYLGTKNDIGTGTIVEPNYVIAPGETVGMLQALGALPNPYIFGATDSTTHDTSYAGYVNASYKITPQLKLQAGLRYTSEQIRSMIGPPATNYATTEHNVSPSVSLTYAITPNANAYATVSQGWYRGGFNTQSNVVNFGSPQFKPEQLTNYEIGFKTSWLDHRLVADVAAFYMDYSNLQVTQGFVEDNVEVTTTTNAAKTAIKGVELEVDALPVEGLTLTGRFGYVDARYDSYANAPTFTLQGEQLLNDSGQSLPYAPNYSASFIGRYERPIFSGWKGWIGGDVGYKSQYMLNSGPAAEVPFFVVQPSTLLDINAGVETEDGRWSIGVYGRNLTNDQYKVGLDITSYQGALVEADQFSDPTTVLVELRFKY